MATLPRHTKPTPIVGVSRPGSGTFRMIHGPAHAPAHEMRPTTRFDATAPCQILSVASLTVPGSLPSVTARFHSVQ